MGEHRRMAWALMLAIAVSSGRDMSGQIRLPGVAGVSFGRAERYKDTAGKEMCAIVEPVRLPAVFRGVTEVSYGVHLHPKTVKTASTQVIAPDGQGTLAREPCNAFTLVPGGFSQTLLGSTISRSDKKPLLPGTYTLRITVDGASQDMTFEIGR